MAVPDGGVIAASALGGFLQSRRARISPQSAGLRAGTLGRRRVPGLRREEIAQLAGISAEYYQRLEQGRAKNPSDEVLDAIADVLRLDHVEREYLRELVHPRRGTAPAGGARARARPQLRWMLQLIDTVPALAITDSFDVLAANPLAERLFEGIPGVLADGNLARSLFLDPVARDFYVEWPDVAAATVAQLRLVAGRHQRDAGPAALIAGLAARSADFSRLWDAGDVELRTYGTKGIRHPAVGVLTLNYENLELPGDSRQRLVTFSPDPDTPTEAALRILAGRTASTLPSV